MFAGLSVSEGLDSGNSMFLIDYAASMEIKSIAAFVELCTVEMIAMPIEGRRRVNSHGVLWAISS
jgi:hypothetical protein